MGNKYEPTQRMNPSSSNYDDGNFSPNYNQANIPGSGGLNKTMALRREPPSFAWLVVVDGIHAGRPFELSSDSTLVGRDPTCNIMLDDAAVSRQHIKIRATEGEDKKKVFVIHDLATENGTLVNDEEIFKCELKDGDVILIGQTRLVFKQILL